MYKIGKIEKQNLETVRKIRAFAIISKGDMPKKIGDETFTIPSQSDSEKRYKVEHNGSWTCSCPDFQKVGVQCKHIQAVEMFLKLRDKADGDILDFKKEFETDEIRCDRCDSHRIVKRGHRKTKHGLRQTYMCKECGCRFTIGPIKHRKANTKLIALCLDLYHKGLSLRKIADTVYQFYGVRIHHDTVRVWINTYMSKITEYVNKFEPNVGDRWNVDEQKIRADGNMVWSWNALDNKTRFLIANAVTYHRNDKSAQIVFKKARNQVGGCPVDIVTDGLKSYPNAIKAVFGDNVTHIGNVGIRDKINNNNVERFHGTYRERDKVMRGLENKETASQMLENYRTYYNFVREHSVLGKTPSEEAGINLELGRNKWLGLITQAL